MRVLKRFIFSGGRGGANGDDGGDVDIDDFWQGGSAMQPMKGCPVGYAKAMYTYN